MEDRETFVKRIDAREYIEKSAREESKQLEQLSNIFDEWGMQLCNTPKEELDKKYEELARKYYSSEFATSLNIPKETIDKCLKKYGYKRPSIEER